MEKEELSVRGQMPQKEMTGLVQTMMVRKCNWMRMVSLALRVVLNQLMAVLGRGLLLC